MLWIAHHFSVLYLSLLAQTDGQQPKPGIIDRVLENVKSQEWIDVTITHTSQISGLPLRATTRFAQAPGRKFRYHLKANLAGSTSEFLMISDGANLWRQQDLGYGPRIHKFALTELDAILNGFGKDKVDSQVKREFLGEYGLSGITPIFRDLQQRIKFSDPVDKEGLVVLLEGQWNESALDQIAPKKDPSNRQAPDIRAQWDSRREFLNVPRSCRLYLAKGINESDRNFWWPMKLEWLGPRSRGGPDEVLTTLEFSENRLGKQPGETVLGELFSVPASVPEGAEMQEIELATLIEARRQALLARQERKEQAETAKPLDIN